MPQGRISGAERVLMELLSCSLPCEVVIFAPTGSDLAVACRSLGYEVRDFYLPKYSDVGARNFARAYARATWRLWRHVKRDQLSVLHAFLSLSVKVVVPVAILRNVPAVLSVHDVITADAIGAFRSTLQRLLTDVGRCHLIAVSGFIRNSLVDAGYKPDKISVIHNGIADSRTSAEGLSRGDLGLSREHTVFLMVARVTPWKGHLVALEAFEMLCADGRYPSARLMLAGGAFSSADDAYARDVQLAVEKSRYRERICQLPQSPHVGDLYSIADAVLVPSVRPDPFPTVVLEAARFDLPVLVTSLGGGKEAVIHEETGLVVDPTARAFRDAMERATDARWRERTGVAAGRFVRQNFSRSSYQERVFNVWRDAQRGVTDSL
jgi:glycosyltransferase involved in cell wall biosynthesis